MKNWDEAAHGNAPQMYWMPLIFLVPVLLILFLAVGITLPLRVQESGAVSENSSTTAGGLTGDEAKTAPSPTADGSQGNSADGKSGTAGEGAPGGGTAVKDTAAGMAAQIADALEKKFTEEEIPAVVDKATGYVRAEDALYFSTNGTELDAAGKALLDRLVPAILSVLFSEPYRDHIDRVLIEGHADDGGNYLYNLNLSQKRAYSAAVYILGKNLHVLEGVGDVKDYFAICGMSQSRPVMTGGRVDRRKSRRVELGFSLKGLPRAGSSKDGK